MFDSVFVMCPVCGAHTELQSKAGECALERYFLPNVPPAIAGDLDGEVWACACGQVWQIVTQTMLSIVPARPKL